ncbi:energy transducer TonB [Ralstonia pickettii]|uniref:Protein TonB n=1 Tax=Ralstonia pickettii (strain 12D) TaxID=428406 RepID=C6BQ87_RALP1|nr:energy transducer TonB [Ralstonia pickettii]
MKIEGQYLVGSSPVQGAGRPREFGKKQQTPVRRFGGLAAVLLIHVALIYALLNGLATKVVQVIQHPVETRIIEPVKPPPPPLPKPTVHQASPKLAPPPFVPPPEVPVQAAPQPTIAHQSAPAPSTPALAPPGPPAPVAQPAPAKAKSTEVGVVCPNSDQVRSSVRYPKEAQENNVTGDVLVEFVVDPQGHITNERIAKSSDDSALDTAAFNAVKKFNCIAQGQSVRVQVPFSFNLN